jgi:dipeptidyl aminopeptidase/acylaminoacyl peptidase
MTEVERYSPLVHVSPDDAPALVIMGGKDELVPPRHGYWITEAFQQHGVVHKLIVFPDAGHGLEGEENRVRLVREAVAWFQTHLAAQQRTAVRP